MARTREGGAALKCSFCGKSQNDVRKLIAGPTVYICDECIELCNDIIAEEWEEEKSRELRSLPKPAEIKSALDQYVVGQELERELKPGEEMETFICTDPEDKRLEEALRRHKGALLWRVQLRRGSVVHGDRRIPCTAVIGVEFESSDINNSPAG